MAPLSGAMGRGLQALRRLTNTVEVERSEQDQARVDAQTSHLELFSTRGCPYCVRVSRCIRRLALKIRLRDLWSDADAATELQREGGVQQVPCLKIAIPGQDTQWLYESADIVTYLNQHYRPQ